MRWPVAATVGLSTVMIASFSPQREWQGKSLAQIAKETNQSPFDVTIDVTDTEQLAQVMSKIGNFSDVISILRMFGRTAGK